MVIFNFHISLTRKDDELIEVQFSSANSCDYDLMMTLLYVSGYNMDLDSFDILWATTPNSLVSMT